jgi:hypothetical protein
MDVSQVIRDMWLQVVQQPPGAVIDGEINHATTTTVTATTLPAAEAFGGSNNDDGVTTNEW